MFGRETSGFSRTCSRRLAVGGSIQGLSRVDFSLTLGGPFSPILCFPPKNVARWWCAPCHCPTIHSTSSATEVIGGSSTDTQRETGEQVMRTTKRLRIGRVALIACALAGAWLQVPAAQVSVLGRWDTVPALVTINPVHMALMHNGKVLIVAGSGNVATNTNFRAIVWDPQTGGFSSPIPLAWDMFCNGMVALPDGQIFINGGNLAYDPFLGERRTASSIPVPALLRTSRTWPAGMYRRSRRSATAAS